MIYFAGGANNDRDGWNYIERFKRIFEYEGIQPFERIDFSLGKTLDVLFTSRASTEAWFPRDVPYGQGRSIPGVFDRSRAMSRAYFNDSIAFQAARHVHESSSGVRLTCGGPQLNLMGYSYGSVLMAHVAVIMTDNGDMISNLVLVGCSIPSNSPLYISLISNGRIGRVIRHDIPGDSLSNPGDWFIAGNAPGMLRGAFQNLDDSGGPHFDLARPDDPRTTGIDEGAEADARIRALARRLYAAGVR